MKQQWNCSYAAGSIYLFTWSYLIQVKIKNIENIVSTYFILTLGLQFVHIEILKSINHGPLVSHREEAAIFLNFFFILPCFAALWDMSTLSQHSLSLAG